MVGAALRGCSVRALAFRTSASYSHLTLRRCAGRPGDRGGPCHARPARGHPGLARTTSWSSWEPRRMCGTTTSIRGPAAEKETVRETVLVGSRLSTGTLSIRAGWRLTYVFRGFYARIDTHCRR